MGKWNTDAQVAGIKTGLRQTFFKCLPHPQPNDHHTLHQKRTVRHDFETNPLYNLTRIRTNPRPPIYNFIKKLASPLFPKPKPNKYAPYR